MAEGRPDLVEEDHSQWVNRNEEWFPASKSVNVFYDNESIRPIGYDRLF